jgi:3-methyladenine DNA glycosylase AlkD
MARSPEEGVRYAMEWLDRHATEKDRANLKRFGIDARNPVGVSVSNIQKLGGAHDHKLAAALWATDCYEARMLAAFVDDPALVTPAQMERWRKDFDNWGICDTVCFHLFDRSPHAWSKVEPWCRLKGEFDRRAGFALLACLAGHDKKAEDAQFEAGLALVEEYATDDRNFVKKAVSWALRRIATRNPALKSAAASTAKRLASSKDATSRWIGKDALRDIEKLREKA